jgi:hypothetical protein
MANSAKSESPGFYPADRVSVSSAIRERGRKKENIWVADLPKTQLRSVIEGDLPLIWAVAKLESDREVTSYVVDSSELNRVATEHGVDPDAVNLFVQYRSGEQRLCKITEGERPPGRSRVDAKTPVANPQGHTYETHDLSELGRWELQFDNWLTLCRAITVTRRVDWNRAMLGVQNILNLRRNATLIELLEEVGPDPALTFGAVARLLHAGLAEADLKTTLLCGRTVVRWREGRDFQRVEMEQRQSELEFAAQLEATQPTTSEAYNPDVGRGRPRRLVCAQSRSNGRWSLPDISVFPLVDQRKFEQRRNAIDLYMAGASCDIIWKTCSLQMKEVRRLYKRCLECDEKGQPYGYFGLIPGTRVHRYRRVRAVDPRRSQKSLGCAGALTMTLTKHADIRKWLDERILGRDAKGVKTFYSFQSLAGEFRAKLTEKGATLNDWPFCRHDQGCQAIRVYAHNLEKSSGDAAPVGGVDAKRRQQIGRGEVVRIQPRRPFSFMQLDYQQAGAGSILIVENEDGKQLEVPVARWYFGLLASEWPRAIAGVSLLFEVEPSADLGLEAISSALNPADDTIFAGRLQYTDGGKFLVRHFLPELAWHGYVVLRVDNALCNRADDFVNNVIDTIGCVLSYGPAYQWWVRQVIESLIGELDRRGLSRLPSTYGTGPDDPRRTSPETKARDLKISLAEIESVIYGGIANINLSPSEASQWSSPIEVLKAAIGNPDQPFFPQPLPLAIQRDNHLLSHLERRVVRGSLERGEAPYARVDRCRYKGGKLSGSAHLLRQWLLLYVDRRDACFARAIVEKTGEDLGMVETHHGLSKVPISWRHRKLIMRGKPMDDLDGNPEPLAKWRQEKINQITKRKGRGGVAARNALDLAAQERTQARSQSTVRETTPANGGEDAFDGETWSAGSEPHTDPFGLNRTPRKESSHD